MENDHVEIEAIIVNLEPRSGTSKAIFQDMKDLEREDAYIRCKK